MFRIGICDDDNAFREEEAKIICEFLEEHAIEYELMSFSQGRGIVDANNAQPFDLVMLDYELPDMTGFEIAKIIKQKDEHTCIAFVTVYLDFSIEGYKYDAVRYIVKSSIDLKSEITELVSNVHTKLLKSREKNNIVIKCLSGELIHLNPSKIIYAINDGHYVDMFIDQENSIIKKRARIRISQIYKVITNSVYARPGEVINMDYVVGVKKDFVSIKCREDFSKTVQIAESRKNDFYNAFLQGVEVL